MTATQKKGRVALLDNLRGVAIIYMVFFHLMYDLAYIWGLPWAQRVISTQEPIAPFFTSLFIIMAGITVRFSRDPARRGARVLLIAVIFTLVTAFVFPGTAIYFGILHLLGACMLVYSLAGKYIDRIPVWIGVLLCAILFAFTCNVFRGYFGIRGLYTLPVPGILASQPQLYYLGFPGAAFSSVDYTPLLPWMFLFLCGSFIGRIFTRELPDKYYENKLPVLGWVGRHSLLIYVLHQPIIFGILTLIFKLKG